MSARRSEPPKSARRSSGSHPKSFSTIAVRNGAKHQLEQSLLDQRARQYVLRLYVTGTSPASARAIEQVRALCEAHLQNRYELEVIDIYQKPALAKDEQIIATPTLIKVIPAPLRRYIGDLSKVDKVLFGLDLREKS